MSKFFKPGTNSVPLTKDPGCFSKKSTDLHFRFTASELKRIGELNDLILQSSGKAKTEFKRQKKLFVKETHKQHRIGG